MTTAHAFVDDLDAPVLSDGDRHHLERVLRLVPGDEVTVSDGRGGWRRCRFGRELDPASPVQVDPRPHPPLTVGFALVKGERPEWVVQKLTELGIDRIVPFSAARSVVRWDGAKATKAQVRLATVAREASMQSRRTWLPDVAPLATFAEAAHTAGAALCDRGGRPPTLALPAALVGPEGGWDDDERAAGLPSITLGPTVLRAETAAVAAGALLAGLRAAIVAEGREPPR